MNYIQPFSRFEILGSLSLLNCFQNTKSLCLLEPQSGISNLCEVRDLVFSDQEANPDKHRRLLFFRTWFRLYKSM